MDFEAKKKEIEDAYTEVANKASDFNKALTALRSIEINLEGLEQEDLNKAIQLGRDIDMRTNFVLRSLLVQHGNVLFL